MARPQEGRHVVTKINRTVSMKIAIEDTKKCNIPVKRERLKIGSQRRGVDETKKLLIPPYLIRLCEWNPIYMQRVLHKWTDKALVQSYHLVG